MSSCFMNQLAPLLILGSDKPWLFQRRFAETCPTWLFPSPSGYTFATPLQTPGFEPGQLPPEGGCFYFFLVGGVGATFLLAFRAAPFFGPFLLQSHSSGLLAAPALFLALLLPIRFLGLPLFIAPGVAFPWLTLEGEQKFEHFSS